MALRIDTPNFFHAKMRTTWKLIADLCGGTPAMRMAGEEYLPREPNEDENDYKKRLERSFLYEGYSDAADRITSKPFSRPVLVKFSSDDSDALVPPRVQAVLNDIDGTGKPITDFTREVFRAAVDFGLTHVLIDYPTVNAPTTLAEENQLRPVAVHITPDRVISWTSEVVRGVERLTMVRFTETRVELQGEIEREVTRIREYTRDEWAVYEKNQKGEWQQTARAPHTFGEVPWRTLYFNRTGFMQGKPPLCALAWMNVVHWQSYSDHRNMLRFARIGIIFVKGLDPETAQKGITIGPGRIVRTSATEASMEYVEHSGNAIDAGVRDLESIEAKMEMLGNQPFISRPGTQTATGQAIDEARSQSDIKAWVASAESFMEEVLKAAAQWMTITLPEEFSVDINGEFGIGFRDASDMQQLLQMRQAGELSRETFLRECMRRGVLSEELSVRDEIDRIESETPDLPVVDPNIDPSVNDPNNPDNPRRPGGDPASNPDNPDEPV